MFWRGETFYTKNEIYEGPDEERTVFDYGTTPRTSSSCATGCADHRGPPALLPVRAAREAQLRSLLPPEARASFQVIDRTHTKFVLAVAQL